MLKSAVLSTLKFNTDILTIKLYTYCHKYRVINLNLQY